MEYHRIPFRPCPETEGGTNFCITTTGAETLFRRYIDENFAIIPIERSDFERAAELAARETLKLRAGDALHLAKVEAVGLQICTMDRNLFDAAKSIAVPALNPAASSN